MSSSGNESDVTPICASTRLIVALDVPSVEEARSIIETLGDDANFYKIGIQLQVVTGVDQLITDIIDSGKQVFLDYKIGDIGASMKANIRSSALRGISFMTIQGGADLTDEIMRDALDGRIDGSPKIFCVTVLTSIDDDQLARLHGGKTVSEMVLERARKAAKWGCDGVICSGWEVASIKNNVCTDLLAITPGVRPKGAESGDQRRVITPANAIISGADYLVVGRPIVSHPDRKSAANSIIEEMQEAFDDRIKHSS
tara:strand:- start:3416 stop:4183 length:768 start_codon:yes stop_codon:yes gene_type:complete